MTSNVLQEDDGSTSVGVLEQVAGCAMENLARVRTSFDLVVNASYAETAPLFGPEGERAWVGSSWDPEFLYPRPAHDEEGAVFNVVRGPVIEVWVNTVFDIEGRHFHYVYFMADLLVTTVDVRFAPVGEKRTQVNVVFTRTALTAAGNERVKTMSETDRRASGEWLKKIDGYLESRNC